MGLFGPDPEVYELADKVSRLSEKLDEVEKELKKLKRRTTPFFIRAETIREEIENILETKESWQRKFLEQLFDEIERQNVRAVSVSYEFYEEHGIIETTFMLRTDRELGTIEVKSSKYCVNMEKAWAKGAKTKYDEIGKKHGFDAARRKLKEDVKEAAKRLQKLFDEYIAVVNGDIETANRLRQIDEKIMAFKEEARKAEETSKNIKKFNKTMQLIESKINELNAKVKSLDDKMKEVDKIVSELEKSREEIKAVKNEIYSSYEAIEEMRKLRKILQKSAVIKKVDALGNKVNKLESRITNIEKEVQTIKEENEELRDYLKSLSRDIKEIRKALELRE